MQNVKRLFIPRPADIGNLNAQAKNVQAILKYWRESSVRPINIFFDSPDPDISGNANVDLLKLRNNRFWRVSLFLIYLKYFDAVFCTGLHHYADWAALRIRAMFGSRLLIVETFEGVSAAADDRDLERHYSLAAGHPVYCQRISNGEARRIDDIYRMSDHIIAISPFMAKLAALRYGDKVSVLPLGVDTNVFSRSSFSRHGRPRVVGAGSMGVHKRPEVFLALASQFPEADFAWFGEGEQRADLLFEVARKGLSNVRFDGEIAPPQLAKEFANADIFVLPSRSEGVPKVTQEAAAAGLAQIVFGFYEAPTVVNGENGFVVWSDDELTARLSDLLKNPDLVETMGRRGIQMAQEWSWEIVAPQWQERIMSILTKSDPVSR